MDEITWTRMNGLRVAIVTKGRFHSFEQARQLRARNCLTEISSGFPWAKLKDEQIPRSMVKTIPWIQVPSIVLEGKVNSKTRKFLAYRSSKLISRVAAKSLGDVNAVIGLSSVGLDAGLKVKRLGGIYLCDRGSTHIRYQDKVLREEYSLEGIPYDPVDPRIIELEEAEYEAADRILNPSQNSYRSFIAEGVLPDKLSVLPLGVNLSKFFPSPRMDSDRFEVLFVGQLSVRKGIRYLIEAFDKIQVKNKRLTLIGSLDSAMSHVTEPLRPREDVRFLGTLPQMQVREYMSQSDVLVLPSIEDGFGMVVSQALACGCPVVVSSNAGAADVVQDGKNGFVVGPREIDGIKVAVEQIASLSTSEREEMSREAIESVKSQGGWDTYGANLYEILQDLIQTRQSDPAVHS